MKGVSRAVKKQFLCSLPTIMRGTALETLEQFPRVKLKETVSPAWRALLNECLRKLDCNGIKHAHHIILQLI